jgi:hypothetical protein
LLSAAEQWQDQRSEEETEIGEREEYKEDEMGRKEEEEDEGNRGRR